MKPSEFRYRIKNETTEETDFYYFTLEQLENGKLISWFKGDKITVLSRDVFTGFRDKNNMRIFDRDILRTPDAPDVIVYWNEKDGGWNCKIPNSNQWKLYNEPYCHLNETINFTSEIIGNEDENP